MGMELVLMDGRLGSSNNYGRGIFGIRLHGMGVMDGWMDDGGVWEGIGDVNENAIIMHHNSHRHKHKHRTKGMH